MPIFVIETVEDMRDIPIQATTRSCVFVVVAENQSAAIRLVEERGDDKTEITQIVGEIEDEGERIVESFTYVE